MEFPRQAYWSGLLFPSPGDLPDPGIEVTFPALAVGFFITIPTGKSHSNGTYNLKQEKEADQPTHLVGF